MADEEKGAEGAPQQTEDATAGLKAKNQELLGEVKALKAKLKAIDFDPEAAREALEFKETAEAELAAKRGEFEKLREKDAAKFRRELEAKAQRESKLVGALEKRLIENELSRALREAGGDPKYLVPIARDRVKAVESETDWETVVYDPKGQPSSMEALVKELRDEYPRAFDGTGASGSGAVAGGATGGGAQRVITDPYELGLAADTELRRRQREARQGR